jgi:NAD(P)-dependent dehydrogenase (short-subunit alcohol dehydrogenase family)
MSSANPRGDVVVITGASAGLGRPIADRFARNGARLLYHLGEALRRYRGPSRPRHDSSGLGVELKRRASHRFSLR